MKPKNRDYKFATARHPLSGIMAFIMGLFSLVSCPVVLRMAYYGKDDVPVWMGEAGIFALILAFCGFIMALWSLREEDIIRFFPRLGIFSSVTAFLAWGFVFVIGYCYS